MDVVSFIPNRFAPSQLLQPADPDGQEAGLLLLPEVRLSADAQVPGREDGLGQGRLYPRLESPGGEAHLVQEGPRPHP